MPYSDKAALPPSIRRVLPEHAQDIFRSAFNAAWLQHADKDSVHREEVAHRIAWAAVKRQYLKVGDSWVPHQS